MSRDRPMSLVAELTYRCPLRCPYCSNPTDCGDARYRRELTTEEWERVFAEAAALGVLQLGLSGGEPLLRPDLEALVGAAARAELYSTLVTAALTMNRERAERLRDAGLDHVQISVQDADAESSDRLAGTRSFARKLEAATVVKALGMPLTVNVVLHRQNLDRIEKILRLAEDLGADRLELANTQYYGWALRNQAALLPTAEQLARTETAVEAARARLGARMQILYVLPDYYEEYPKPCSGGWGRQVMVVAPHGDVMPCHAAASIPGLEFASVRDHTLEWIWFESPAFNRFRGADWMPEPCRSCPRNEADFGGCRCQALLLTGNASATDPVCHLSPHHQLVVDARERAQSEGPAPLVYRSMKAPPAGQ
jgi:pyrroloquinoline quinone biosynthesis protein E